MTRTVKSSHHSDHDREPRHPGARQPVLVDRYHVNGMRTATSLIRLRDSLDVIVPSNYLPLHSSSTNI